MIVSDFHVQWLDLIVSHLLGDVYLRGTKIDKVNYPQFRWWQTSVKGGRIRFVGGARSLRIGRLNHELSWCFI